jgi:hypothetical protein
MIISHPIKLETVLNEDSNEPSAKKLLAMSEDERQEFLTEAATSFIANFLVIANEGMSWAEIRVAK